MAQTNLVTSIGYLTKTIEEIANYAPAAFTENKSPKTSKRYSFVSTYDQLSAFDTLGWSPAYARQNGSGPYARHMVRLNNPNLGFIDLAHDKIKPQLILDNSHNGSSSAQIHMGLFRLVCTNGLVIAMPGMFTSVKLRHVGINIQELKQLMEVVAQQYNTIGAHIAGMQQYALDKDQREEFVIKAIAAREPHVFIKKDGTIDMKKATTIINPNQILQPVRGEDESTDLWTVFNVIQERFVKGEFDRQTMSGRKTRPRGINNASRHLDFNIKLWQIAEEYMAPADAQLVS